MVNVCPVGYVVTTCMTLFQDNNSYANLIGSKKKKNIVKRTIQKRNKLTWHDIEFRSYTILNDLHCATLPPSVCI